MPQMAPYNWLILFFMFNMIIIVIMTHNHFMLNFNLNNLNPTIHKLNFNKILFKWMW